VKTLEHVVLTNPESRGFEYAVLRDLEFEIARLTKARLVGVPNRAFPGPVAARLAHGTRYGFLRAYVPRKAHTLRADVLWVPLMSPANFTLDLFRGWDRGCGIKILYLFDSFESQVPVLKRVLSATHWDLTVTSFAAAVPMLERETGRHWHAVPQGVRLDRFRPFPAEKREIAFSAYGRRIEALHEVVRGFCRDYGLYYDYSVAAGVRTDVPTEDLGAMNAWHLGHSVFTFSWPVEQTNPTRVRTFSPITCRWFEAAACGTVMLGRAPRDPSFSDLFGEDLVVALKSDPSRPEDVRTELLGLWHGRGVLLERAARRRGERGESWSWENRVRKILELAALPPPDVDESPSAES
jgi:hypothetical protein